MRPHATCVLLVTFVHSGFNVALHSLAQDRPDRLGVVISVEGDVQVPGMVQLMPPQWKAPVTALARYRIQIAPTAFELQTCEYGFGQYRLVRRRVDATVTVVDFETDKELARQGFQGSTPDDCPSSAEFDMVNARYLDGVPDAAQFFEWLQRTMRGLPGLTELTLPALTLTGHQGGVLRLAVSPDGRSIATVSRGGLACIKSVDTSLVSSCLEGHDGTFAGLHYSPDGAQLIGWSRDVGHVWDAATGRKLFQLRGHTLEINDAKYCPKGRFVVTASADGTGRVWDAQTGQPLAVLSGHEADVWSAAYSPDGTTIATVSDKDGSVRVWDAGTHAERLVIRGIDALYLERENGVGYSPDGASLFVSGDAIPRSKVWNAVTGALRFTLQGSHLRFSADGRLIATRFSPDAVAMFSADTGKTRLKVNVDGVYDVVFSPGGPFFVTTGRDATARLWSAETGKVVGELAAYNSSGNTHWYAVFQPDGRRVALAHPERDTVPIWDITGLVR